MRECCCTFSTTFPCHCLVLTTMASGHGYAPVQVSECSKFEDELIELRGQLQMSELHVQQVSWKVSGCTACHEVDVAY